MADTMTTPAKATKKKKPLAFLKSAPKPAPTIDLDGDASNKNDDDDDDDALDLFRRSKDFFPVVVQEQESPRMETPDRKKSDHGQHDSDGSTHSPSPRSVKRRKLSTPARSDKFWDSPEDLYGPATPPERVPTSPSPTPYRSNKKKPMPSPAKPRGIETVQLVQSDILPTPSRSNSHQLPEDEVVSIKPDLEHVTPNDHAIHTRSSTRGREDLSVLFKKEELSPGPITLDDSDDDLIETTSPPDEEDPFAHFVQRAREREAAAVAKINDETKALGGDTSKKREPLAEAKIFVFSRMSKYPDIPTFGAKRGLHQNLGIIRKTYITWMRNKGIAVSDEDESQIFLTWKGRRIYDVSTGISLGWKPSANGEFPPAPRTSGFKKGGVLLEAWTQEDLDNEIAAQELQKRMDRGELVDDFPDDQPEDEQAEAAAKVRISLKEKDQEPVKMSVQGDYEIRLVIGVYRKMKKIPDDREIKLRYEGEWLDGAVTVNEADIEDLCTVEVYIK